MISLMTLLSSAGAQIEESSIARSANKLRLALAVRGWVDPRPLVPGELPNTEQVDVLNAVAPDVEVAPRSRAGHWYLRDQERRKLLTTSKKRDLAEALLPRGGGDATDPVRCALELRRRPLDTDFRSFGTDLLTAIGNTFAWLNVSQRWEPEAYEFWHPEPTAAGFEERIAATLARRVRLADIERITTGRLYGRDRELGRLAQWATEPPSPTDIGRVLYLSGLGGAGKSTLFAHLEKQLGSAQPRPLVVHLDCDMPGFDPTDPIALDLALFRQLSVAAPEHAQSLMQKAALLSDVSAASDREYAGQGRRKRRRQGARSSKAEQDENVQSFTAQEAAVGQKQSQRYSISYEALASVTAGRPLVLLFDTVELLLARGRVAVAATVEWFASLRSLMNGLDNRVLMAGRSPPDVAEVKAFADEMIKYGWLVETSLCLEDLDVANAGAMLSDLGVKDKAAVNLMIEVLPRTPLILKIAADIYRSSEDERTELVGQLRRSVISPEVARRYLTERIINHLASPAARPYALASVVLPQVTAALIEKVVIPIVSEHGEPTGFVRHDLRRQRSMAVFKGLREAGWLVRQAPDGASISFHPELRRLVLQFMQHDPKCEALLTAIRREALSFYRTRRKKSDLAFRVYFEEMLGIETPSKRRRSVDLTIFGPAIEDLSPEARFRLGDPSAALGREEGGTASRPERQSPFGSDDEWRVYLEGSGSRDGEGDRLVKRGHADAALELYRRRPTRPHGVPPTFVLQALADAAHWRTDEVDVEAIVEQIADLDREGAAHPHMVRSRLYWLSRFQLSARPGPLSPRHHEVLCRAARRFSGSGPVLLLPGISAVAEAFAPERGPIAPNAWFGMKGPIESETRMFLVHHLLFNRAATWKPYLDALFVPHPTWADVVARSANKRAASELKRFLARFADWAFSNKESPPSLVEFNRLLRDARVAVEISIGGGTDPSEAALILRGQTTEFHRPLRAALMRYATVSPAAKARLVVAADGAMDRLMFRPKELRQDEWASRVNRDFGAALALLLPFLDRCRKLPEFCRNVLVAMGNAPHGTNLDLVASSFLRWDRAICSGAKAEWP